MDSDRNKEKQKNNERHKGLQDKFDSFQRDMDVQLTALGDAVAKMHDDMKEAREANFNQFAAIGNQMAQLMQLMQANSPPAQNTQSTKARHQSGRKDDEDDNEPRRQRGSTRSPHRAPKAPN